MPAPTLDNLRRLLALSAAKPHRAEVSGAVREATRRGGMERFALAEGPIRRGMPEFSKDTILDYSNFGDPYSHLSERNLGLSGRLSDDSDQMNSVLRALRSPNQVRDRLDLMRAGAGSGGHLWYNTQPLRQFGERYAPNVDVNELLRFTSPMSAQTPVDSEIMQGIFGRYFLKKHGRLPTQDEMSQALPSRYTGTGVAMDKKLTWAQEFMEGASPKMNKFGEPVDKPKLRPYSWAKEGDVRNPIIDSHILATYNQPNLGWRPKNALGVGVQHEALDAGMMPTEAQAGMWTERIRRGYIDRAGDEIKGNPRGNMPFVHAVDRLVGESAESVEKSKTQHLIDILQSKDYARHGPQKFQTGGLAALSAAARAWPSRLDVERQSLLAPALNLEMIRNFSPRKYNLLMAEYLRSQIPEEFRGEPLRRIKAGSGRATFMMGDDKIAKLAQMPRGFAEMAGEGEPFLAEAGLLPKALWKDPENEIAILERVPHRASKSWVNPMMKAIFNDSMPRPNEFKGPLTQDLMRERDMERMLNYRPLIGDFGVPQHWGFKSDVANVPLQRRRGTLLDPGAIQPNLLSRGVNDEYSGAMSSANEARMAFIRNLAGEHKERRALDKLREQMQSNPAMQLPGFMRGGPVRLAGGGDPARLLMLLNRAQKALGSEATIRSGGQRIPLGVAAEDLRGLTDQQLNGIADIYSKGSRQGYSARDLKAMIADHERNLGRVEELHDICQGPLGKRLGICFPERGFAGGGIVRNWLKGVKGSGIEQALEDLKKPFAPRTAWADEAGRTVEAAKVGGDKRNEAIQKWIDRNLANYITRQAGTPDDPLHAEWRRMRIPGARDLHGGLAANEFILKIPAADVQRRISRHPFKDEEEQAAHLKSLPWLQKLIEQDQPRAWSEKQAEKALLDVMSPDARTLALSQERINDQYGRRFAKPIELHDIDTAVWQANMRGPMREVLDYLGSQVRPESLNQVSVPDAMRKSREWHAMLAKRKANDLTNRMAELKPVKEYPGGYRWLDLGEKESDVAQNIGKHLGHCYQDPETCADYMQRGNLLALMKGSEPRAVLEKITEGIGDPDLSLSAMHQQAREQGPWRIGQIRGSQKKRGSHAPDPEDLPYIQDLIRSGKWGGVEELENAGLMKAHQGNYHSIEDVIKHGRGRGRSWASFLSPLTIDAQTLAEYIAAKRAARENTPLPWLRLTDDQLKDAWLQDVSRDGFNMPEGMASGGLVDESVFERVHDKYPELPRGLLRAVAQAESNMNPKALGKRGEQGMMQFMPATAKQYKVDPWDVESSVMGAGEYLDKLHRRFGGVEAALGAYNWGPGNVSTYGMEKAPQSTRAYIGKVLSMLGSGAMGPVGRALKIGMKVPDNPKATQEGVSSDISGLPSAQELAAFDNSAQDDEDALDDEEVLAYLMGTEEEAS